MRKIVAVVLAVLMLASVLAMLPASAATTGTYDGTTKDTEGLNKIIITEIAPNATYHPNGVAESQNAKEFPLNFIELYNNKAGDVDLSTLSILRGVNIPQEPSDETDPYLTNSNGAGVKLWRLWRDKKFISKIDIKAGAIVDEATAKATTMFEDENPATPALDNVVYSFLTNDGVDMTFSSGENVVLWFISSDTVAWMDEREGANADFNPREEFVKSFYGANADVSQYTVVMVWAWSDFSLSDPTKIATDTFALSALATTADRDYIYGVANNTWDLDNDKAYDATAGIDTDLYSMAVMGTSVKRYNGMAVVDTTATFAVSTTKPYIANAYEALTEINPTTFNNYFDADLVESFREVGVIDWASKATPGSMPAWQWAMVDADAYDAFKTEGTLDAAKVQAAVDAYITELKLVDNSTGREENDDRDYNFQTQEELKNQFYNNNKGGGEEEEDGLPLGALIGIIVGAVVVVAGAACAVIFLVVLPKKKAAAAVAAEAPAAEEAPAEEAPAEAPAEEEKKDE